MIHEDVDAARFTIDQLIQQIDSSRGAEIIGQHWRVALMNRKKIIKKAEKAYRKLHPPIRLPQLAARRSSTHFL
jgi:hypothetical protein